MSASSNPTLAPCARSETARLTATVDLPTPPLPDPIASTCLTPGIARSRGWPPKADFTLAVMRTSTAVTPGSLPTRSLAIALNLSRTVQAGVVSSNVNATRPSSLMARSLIIPRLTTSRWRSGSWMEPSAARTCSGFGGSTRVELLATEDDRRAQSEHADEHQHGYQDGVGADGRDRGAAPTATRRPHAPALCSEPDQRSRQADQGQGPKGRCRDRPRARAGVDHGDEERDQQDQLQQREVTVRQTQAHHAVNRLRPVARQQRDQRGRTAQARRQEEAAQRPGVAPDRLVGDAEQHAGVRGEEQARQGADDVERDAERTEQRRSFPAAPVGEPGPERGEGCEDAEHQQQPHAYGHRRPVLEVQARIARGHVHEHVPELPPAGPQVRREQQGTQRDQNERG